MIWGLGANSSVCLLGKLLASLNVLRGVDVRTFRLAAHRLIRDRLHKSSFKTTVIGPPVLSTVQQEQEFKEKNMKKLFIALSLVVASLTAAPAFAHGQGHSQGHGGGVGVYVGRGGIGVGVGGGQFRGNPGYGYGNGYRGRDWDDYRRPYYGPGWGRGPGFVVPPVYVPPVVYRSYRVDRCGNEYWVDNYGRSGYTGRYFPEYDYCN